MNLFAEYAQHGWKLAPITAGLKGPTATGWNRPESLVSHPLAAATLGAAGLAHAYSGTCAIDLDDLEAARRWFAARGIDLDALLAAPDAVRIKSPAANRGKLIYKLATPLPSKKISGGDDGQKTILELRCGTSNGLTVQDVLPPSPHPDASGNIDGFYEWLGDWRNLPELPRDVLTLWSNLIGPAEGTGTVGATVTRDQLIATLRQLSPDAGYDEWLRIGMAIHNEYNGSNEGLALWDAWSKRSTKYKGIQDLHPHWKSFSAGGGVTAATLEQMVPWSAADMPDEARIQAINNSVEIVQPIFGATAAELLRPVDLPPFLVDGMLERRADASLIGPAKSGKSLFALELSVCIATGEPFFGRETDQGLVVYLCGEGQRGLALRAQALRRARNLDFGAAPLHIIPRAFPLATEQGVRVVQTIVREAEQRYNRKLALLVIDTYGRYSSGEENVAEDLYEFFRTARACAGDAALLVVHHTGHSDAGRGRGTSAWEQLVDTEFVAQIKEDTHALIFENTKQKDAEPMRPMYFQLSQQMTDSTRVGQPIYSVVLEQTIAEAPAPKLGSSEQIVYDAVAEGSGTTEEIVARAAANMPAPLTGHKDKRRASAERTIKSLVGKGELIVKSDFIFKAGDPAAEFI